MHIPRHHHKLNPLITLVIIAAAIVLGLIGSILYKYDQTGALHRFNPGNIIDDQKMSQVNSMSETQIRNFIKDKNKNCSNGNSLCFKNYKEGSKDAARLIYEAAQEQKINPQVILVTIQKEQGLITRIDPAQWMYNSAMGYACPDSTPGKCGSGQKGFLRQIVWGATMYRAILDGGGKWSNRYKSGTQWYTPYNLGINSILWNPKASCGSSTVNIQNRATQALYNYTPYRPNQAALNAGYGEGDSCSAYGNRNFYSYMRDWFNYTVDSVEYSGLTFSEQPFSEKEMTISFTVRNTGSRTVDLGRIKVVARDSSGNQSDFASISDVSIRANQTFTYKSSRTIEGEGQFDFYVARYHNEGWIRPQTFIDLGNNASTNETYTLIKAPQLVQPLELSESNIHQNQPLTATFSIRNNSDIYPVELGRFKIRGKHSDGTQRDFDSTANNLTIPKGTTYRYESTQTLPKIGNYELAITNFRDEFKWRDTFPSSVNAALTRSMSVSVGQPTTITKGLDLSSSILRTGESTSATFAVTNFSNKAVNIGRTKVKCMHPSAGQYDFASTANDLTLAAGETYEYSAVGSLPAVGAWTCELANFREAHKWSANYPVSESGGVKRKVNASVNHAVTLTKSLSLSTGSAHQNQNITTTFAVKNHSNKAVNIGRTKVKCMHPSAGQYDFASTANDLTLAAGETYEYSAVGSLPAVGAWTCRLANIRTSTGWNANYPTNENSSIKRDLSISVKQPVTLTEGLATSKSTAKRGENITTTFAVKNHSNKAVNIGRTKVKCMHPSAGQYDFASTVTNLKLSAGQTYRYSATGSFPTAGVWTCELANFREAHKWSANYPVSESSSVKRKIPISVTN